MSRPGIEPVTIKFPGEDTLSLQLPGQVRPLCTHEDTVHILMFRCSRSVQMLHNVTKNNFDLFEVHVHVFSFQIHVHVQLQVNLKCTDARPQII